ncbi:MAG: nucleotidyltransferase domain-containing protein, partial [Promethearchaeota archaeon]
MAEKTKRLWDKIEIVYDREHWDLLKQYRQKTLQILKALEKSGICGFVHGSIVRGDVDEQSDIDIITAQHIPSQKIEISFLSLGYKIYSRRITQATPRHTLKGHIFLDPSEKISITFPLFPFRKLEYEFYEFGGILDRKGIEKMMRAPGCTKRLTF